MGWGRRYGKIHTRQAAGSSGLTGSARTRNKQSWGVCVWWAGGGGGGGNYTHCKLRTRNKQSRGVCVCVGGGGGGGGITHIVSYGLETNKAGVCAGGWGWGGCNIPPPPPTHIVSYGLTVGGGMGFELGCKLYTHWGW